MLKKFCGMIFIVFLALIEPVILAEPFDFEPEMVFINGGDYVTLPDENKSIEPAKVEIRDFWISRYEITFGQYDEFCRDTGYYKKRYTIDLPMASYRSHEKIKALTETYPKLTEEYKDDEGFWDNRPVVRVCWLDAMAYCVWLSKKTGKHYRLPSQVEWEFACTAGGKWNHDNNLSDFAWYRGSRLYEDGELEIHAVGQKKPNPLGLYDFLGSVWEWCMDGPADPAYPFNVVVWEQNCASLHPVDLVENIQKSEKIPGQLKSFILSRKSRRGGSYREHQNRVNAHYRVYEWINKSNYDLGFRVACSSEGAFENVKILNDMKEAADEKPVTEITKKDMKLLLNPPENRQPSMEQIDPETKERFEAMLGKKKWAMRSLLKKTEAEYEAILFEYKTARKHPLVKFHKKMALLKEKLESENFVRAAELEDMITARLDKNEYREYQTIANLYGRLAWSKENLSRDRVLLQMRDALIDISPLSAEEYELKFLKNSDDKLKLLLEETTVPEALLYYAEVRAPLHGYVNALTQIISEIEPEKASKKGREIEEIYIRLKNLEETPITKELIEEMKKQG